MEVENDILEKIIKNIKVYGLEDSIKRSKYPMSADVDELNDEVTKTVHTLAKSRMGEGHDNFLNGIIVQFDLTFTIKAWTELQRYHFIDFVSSQSTIHRISRLVIDEAYVKYTDSRIVRIMKELVENYNKEMDSKRKQEKYLEILYSNPCGMKLTAGMTTNYRQLKTIYKQRKNHRLPEWQIFCKQLEELPYHEWITEN